MEATTAERGHAAPGEAARAAPGEAARAAPGEAAHGAPALAVEPPTGWQFVLERARQRAVVTEVGATLRSWRVGGNELLDTFAVDAAGDGFRGKVLMPWPGRIRGGRYVFGGAAHRLPVNEPERDAALHGLVLWSSFRPVRRSAREVALAHRLHPQPGYPFTLDLEVTYALTPGALVVTIAATNLGARPAPFGAGFHPYLQLDGALLEVPGRSAQQLGARDTCFGDLDRDARGRSTVRLRAPGGDRELRAWMDPPFRYVHVDAPDGRAVAIAPMTCAPDAFNSGEGLLVLDPGETFSARVGLEAHGF